MLVKVRPEEKERVMAFLAEEPEFNLFILGDIANHGLETDHLELWAQFAADKSISAVVLRYFGTYLVSAREDFDEWDVAGFLGERGKIQALSGKDEVVSRLLPHLVELSPGKLMHFAKLSELALKQLPAESARWGVSEATLADLGRIAILRAQIFKESKIVVRQMLHQGLTLGAGRCYFIEYNGEIVASCQTTAEYDKAAMIVGVATNPAYRRMGMATACLHRLCHNLLAEGKSPCLFYDNPHAGALYHRLGFEDIGYWRMATAQA